MKDASDSGSIHVEIPNGKVAKSGKTLFIGGVSIAAISTAINLVFMPIVLERVRPLVDMSTEACREEVQRQIEIYTLGRKELIDQIIGTMRLSLESNNRRLETIERRLIDLPNH